LAPAQLAPDDRRQVPLLLHLVAVFQERRAEHDHAHAADRVGRADRRHLLGQHLGLGATEPGAAIGLGPGRRAVAGGRHPFLPQRRVAGDLGPGRLGVGHRAGVTPQGRREVRLQPSPDLRPEGVQVIAAEIGHVAASTL
jgi:hypothetical protein